MSDNDYYEFEELQDELNPIIKVPSADGLFPMDDRLVSQASFRMSRQGRVLPTSVDERQRLEELLRIHHWADISKRGLGGHHHLRTLDSKKSTKLPLWKRVKNKSKVKLGLMNLYSAGVSITVNGWGVEQLFVVMICLSSTLAYCLAPTPSNPHLASQLDFHYLATSLVYLVSFAAQQTLRRRDTAVQYLRTIRAQVCQMTLAFLLWNRDRPRPSDDFAERVVDLFQRGCYHCFCVLKIPTWNRTRHYFTKDGMRFRQAMRRRLYHHRKEFTRFIFDVHQMLEEVKDSGTIETHETTRLSDYAKSLNVCVEQIQLIKEYRTTNIARSFVRVFLLMCPAMYGVYFSFIAGNVFNGPATTELLYSLALMFASIALLIVLVNLERAMEDPCTTEFRGDNIMVGDELEDLYQRLEMIRDYCSAEWKAKFHQYRTEQYEQRENEEINSAEEADMDDMDADDEADDDMGEYELDDETEKLFGLLEEY